MTFSQIGFCKNQTKKPYSFTFKITATSSSQFDVESSQLVRSTQKSLVKKIISLLWNTFLEIYNKGALPPCITEILRRSCKTVISHPQYHCVYNSDIIFFNTYSSPYTYVYVGHDTLVLQIASSSSCNNQVFVFFCANQLKHTVYIPLQKLQQQVALDVT